MNARACVYVGDCHFRAAVLLFYTLLREQAALGGRQYREEFVQQMGLDFGAEGLLKALYAGNISLLETLKIGDIGKYFNLIRTLVCIARGYLNLIRMLVCSACARASESCATAVQ